MFNKKANAVFNRGSADWSMIHSMHEQMIRLYEAARALKRTEGQTEVAKLLDALPQTLNNWESRGISDQGLLKAQELIGCDAIWLRDGSGSMVRGSAAPPIDLNDVAVLISLYGQSTEQGRRLILEFAKDTPKLQGK